MKNKLALHDNPKFSALYKKIQQPTHPKQTKTPPLIRLLRVIIITFKEFQANSLSLRASALTYTILLSLVPILAMSTAVIKGLGGGDELRQVAYNYVSTLEHTSSFITPLPQAEDGESPQNKAEITAHLRTAVDQIFDYVDRTNFATLGSFGFAGIFLTVILVLSHIETAMNAIWKVKNSRSLLRKISDYLTLLVLFPLSANIAFAASAFLNNPKLNAKIDFFIPLTWLQPLILQCIPVVSISLTLYVVYLFFPNTKVKTVPALCGALIAGFAWFAVQNVYISMQISVAKYNAIYGSFATVPLFLIWIYLGWVFILAGAQFAFALQHNRHYNLATDEPMPSLQLSAAFDIMGEIQESFTRKERITSERLILNLNVYPTALIEKTIHQLQTGGALYLINDKYIVPAGPKNCINQEALVTIILGQNTPETAGGMQSRTILEAAQKA